MTPVDPQVEALIRAGLKPQAQEQVPQQLLVPIQTPDGAQQVPVPLAMVIILDKILDELIAIRQKLDPTPDTPFVGRGDE
jgi:hypothetical protein